VADYLKVNTAMLRIDAERLRQKIGKMRQQLVETEWQIRRQDAMWSGPLEEESKNAMHGAITQMEDLLGRLEKLCSYEMTSRIEYERAERKVSAVIAEIRM
jgi:uncharacterized protein YukE